MNKSAIQKYAIWARNELRDQIAKRGYYFGIDADGINVDGKDETCVYARDGRLLTDTERKQRNELFRLVKEKGFDQVVEEVSYTWFNRLIALRFMEVNDYLPEHIRVLSNANNEFKPEIKTRALDLEDPHFDKKKILDLIDKNDDEELYRYLLLTECNALNDILPQMFEKIGGYTELLLPNNLLKADSVIGKLVSDIDEADWDVKSEGGQVQIIGWLYQYYNQELKDETFADLKKNKKISKERIPAATQLFTPDWIVHYMVENSLGRMWIEGHPNDELKSTWKYYLDEAEQEPEVEEQLKEIRKEYSKLNPQDIKFFDPAMGSGHILVVAFDILMQIYESQGIRPREAAKSILENNLYGLDIDDRAAQLAYFAVMMKAREYDRRIFSRGIQPNLYSIQESNGIDDSLIDYVAGGDKKLHSDLKTLVKEMKDAKEFGSIITVSELDFDRLEKRLNTLNSHSDLLSLEAIEKINLVVKVDKILAQKYEIVCTNPPYMGYSNMNSSLTNFVKEFYPTNKSDLFACFIEAGVKLLRKNGILSMITQHTWMFLGAYESLRNEILSRSIISLVHLGIKAFEEIGNDVVQTCSFTVQNSKKLKCRIGTYSCLVDVKDAEQKRDSFIKKENVFLVNNASFVNVPEHVIAYYAPRKLIDNFRVKERILDFADFTGNQNVTGNNNKYLRYIWEVDCNNVKRDYWVIYAKGGDYRKYYGNLDIVVDWRPEARKQYASTKTSQLLKQEYWYRPGITYSAVTSRGTGFRYLPPGCVFDKGGPTINVKENLEYILALLNSKVAETYFKVLNPSINLQVKDIRSLPIIFGDVSEISQRVKENIELAKADWDSYETSINFKSHPLIGNSLISKAFNEWERIQQIRFDTIYQNECKNNQLISDLYGIAFDKSSIENRDIPIHNPNIKEDIKSLLSYAVGCMFGRYSLTEEGIVCSNTKLNSNNYQEFKPDMDNIIPIGNDEYFDDDLITKFYQWLGLVYGEENVEENLRCIAKILGGTGTPREVIRKYFLNDFYTDHCKTYKKHPIYWLFDSGKKNGFKCLIYMHRYTPDTLARIRTDYVHEQQERYRSQIKHIQEIIDTVSKSEQVRMKKELKDLEAKSKEVAVFEEKLHHLADQMIEIDLDDGVKHNYALFQDVLAKIK